MRVFLDILNVLVSMICKKGPDLTIVAGDFNAKAVTWGSRFTDKRGFEILEMAARNDLRPIRSRGDFTFERNGHKSLIDILLCSKNCVMGLEISEILEVYTASDHRYLRHVFKSKDKDVPDTLETAQILRTKVDISAFMGMFHAMTWAVDLNNVETVYDIDQYVANITQLVKDASRKVHPVCNNRRAVWWWNQDTARARRDTIRARRTYQRARIKPTSAETVDILKKDYMYKKKNLKLAIFKAKIDSWQAFVETIDHDPWGKPYRWVINKLRGGNALTLPKREQVDEVVEKLFVTTQQNRHGPDEAYAPTDGVDADDLMGADEMQGF
ncbi:uncharacterized protein LOC144477501 [Augochlora pura]